MKGIIIFNMFPIMKVIDLAPYNIINITRSRRGMVTISFESGYSYTETTRIKFLEEDEDDYRVLQEGFRFIAQEKQVQPFLNIERNPHNGKIKKSSGGDQEVVGTVVGISDKK